MAGENCCVLDWIQRATTGVVVVADCLLGVGTWLRTVLELPKGVLVTSLFEVTEQSVVGGFTVTTTTVCVCERERERERECSHLQYVNTTLTNLNELSLID